MQHLKIATEEGTERGREGERGGDRRERGGETEGGARGRDKRGETALTEQHKEAMRQET